MYNLSLYLQDTTTTERLEVFKAQVALESIERCLPRLMMVFFLSSNLAANSDCLALLCFVHGDFFYLALLKCLLDPFLSFGWFS